MTVEKNRLEAVGELRDISKKYLNIKNKRGVITYNHIAYLHQNGINNLFGELAGYIIILMMSNTTIYMFQMYLKI